MLNSDKGIASCILVLGAYGLIGAEVFKALKSDGHRVVPLGRNFDTASRVLPTENWIIQDIAGLTNAQQWKLILEDVDFVVNCAGALQASRFDDLDNLHHHAIAALAKACLELDIGLIQISAVGAKHAADTEFLASKGRGDDSIRTHMKRYWIFCPGLVLSHTAYGGTQLIRMIAAVPFIQPIAFGASKVQTIAVDDVALAVVRAVRGDLPVGLECDLVEANAHSLRDIVLGYRNWLGFPKARAIVTIPKWSIRMMAPLADALGYLGWRSPLRSTSVSVLENGVLGAHDPSVLKHTKSLNETLAGFPATVEDRLFARMALLMPLVVGLLSLFWVASGVIGILRVNTATTVLTDIGWPSVLASASVLFWAVVDILLGCAILQRKYSKSATLGMVLVSLLYLLFASIFAPNLWLDPLGPLVKILPGIGLALVVRVLLESR